MLMITYPLYPMLMIPYALDPMLMIPYLFIIPVPGILPHDPGNSRLFAAECYDTADIECRRNIMGLVQVAGNAELPGRGLHNFVAIVMVDVCVDMPGGHFNHQPVGIRRTK